MSPRRPSRADAGQGTLEYIAGLALVALVLSLVLAADPGGIVTGGTRGNVADVLAVRGSGDAGPAVPGGIGYGLRAAAARSAT